jgi:dolichol-phosphate mannosyltransferase
LSFTPVPHFAIVIPMKNEIGACADLLSGCVAAVQDLGPFEILVTDDGSDDGTGAALAAWGGAHREVRLTVLRHPRSAGQSAAVHSAVHAASAPIIATLDGDGQNPPSELPKLLAPFLGPDRPARLGLVAGQRTERHDPLAKRLASRLANGLRGAMLRDGTRDTGCGLKAFRRDAFLALPYFNHMHRYLPALFARDGWAVGHIDVAHRARESGASKYTNLGRALVGVSDLLGVAWLIRRRRSVPVWDVAAHQPGDAGE